jgi:hypothetical protein
MKIIREKRNTGCYSDHKEHASSLFHFNAKKVFSDVLSYARIQAVDQYLKGIGQPLHKKYEASSFYLTEEQYREVMYLTIIYLQLLILQISSKTMEYICGCHGCKIIYQVTLLCTSIGQAVNSSKCQKRKGKTEVISLNTPMAPMDISAKL